MREQRVILKDHADAPLFRRYALPRTADCLLAQADFAIGSLARHRSGIDKIKTLKNREYAARGISFAYSETDEDFDKMPYILKVPANESPIDIHRLIRFYMELDLSPRKIRDSIKNLSWKEQMMKVINNL